MANIGFYGAAGAVTGANFLLDTGAKQVLIDCGLIQGGSFSERKNAVAFGYDPKSVDALFVTHAHADHIGRIPKLVRDGFSGTIYSTFPTMDLAAVMLRDAYTVMSYEAEKYNTQPIYEPKDIDATLALWQGIEYKKEVVIGDGVSAMLHDAGHILGSAGVVFVRNGKRIAFSGDIGNVPQPLLGPPDIPAAAEYLVMESVYGDRLHEEVEERSEMLARVIEDTIARRGTLIIPAFSLERTQAMLFEINNFVESGRIVPIPTFLDSPLAISVTEIYKKHLTYLKEDIQKQIEEGDDIFDFPKLSFTRTKESSKDIAGVAGPKIIIAGSGMSHGGRILDHERRYLEDEDTTLLLVGYQAVGSMGRKLQDGAKKIRIYDTDVKVRARIETIRGYSGHADRDALMEYAEKSAETLKKVFVTMGEEKSALFLVQRLRDYLGLDAVAPDEGEVVEIDF